jgi:PilZ domain
VEERRKEPRFEVSVAVHLALGADRFRGLLKDICRDAALLEVGRTLAEGAAVALVLQLPGTGGPLHLLGKVVRTAPRDHGGQEIAVVFVDLTPAAETRLDYFVTVNQGSSQSS